MSGLYDQVQFVAHKIRVNRVKELHDVSSFEFVAIGMQGAGVIGHEVPSSGDETLVMKESMNGGQVDYKLSWVTHL